MIKETLGASLDRILLRAAPAIERIPLSANQLTAVGVVLSAAAAAAFAWGSVPLGGLLLMPAGFCDLVDGVVARARGTASRAGAFLDSTMDRVSDLLIFGGLGILAARTGDPGRALLVFWALSAAVLTSYTRARAECEIDELRAGILERGERCGVLIVFALLDQIGLALWITAILGTITAIQRIAAGYRKIGEAEARAQALDPSTRVAGSAP